VAHVEHPASGLTDHNECFHQDFVQSFLQSLVLLFLELLRAVGIVLRLRFGIRRSAARHTTQTILNSLTELVRLSAQFSVRELLGLRFESIDSLDLGHQTLDDALVLGPKDLADQSVNQTVKSFRGRELP